MSKKISGAACYRSGIVLTSYDAEILTPKKGAKIDISLKGLTWGRPSGRADCNRFFTKISQEHATRAKIYVF